MSSICIATPSEVIAKAMAEITTLDDWRAFEPHSKKIIAALNAAGFVILDRAQELKK